VKKLKKLPGANASLVQNSELIRHRDDRRRCEREPREALQ
jgi:hypothetical protein